MTDKRYRIGIWVTGLYLLTLAIYAYVQRNAVLAMEPNEFGDALAGAASPLAFLWLVLGYLQQGEELRQNTEALNLQVRELQASVNQQRALVEATQRQHEFELARERARRRVELLSKQPSFDASFELQLTSRSTTVLVCKLKNVGLSASKTTLDVRERSNWIKVEPAIVLSFDRGAEERWRIVVSEVPLPAMTMLDISYTDANGESQKQELQIAVVRVSEDRIDIFPNGHPKLVLRDNEAAS